MYQDDNTGRISSSLNFDFFIPNNRLAQVTDNFVNFINRSENEN